MGQFIGIRLLCTALFGLLIMTGGADAQGLTYEQTQTLLQQGGSSSGGSAAAPTVSATPAQAAQPTATTSPITSLSNPGQSAAGILQNLGGTRASADIDAILPPPPPAPPGEFEKYVESAMGHSLPRFGSSLLLPGARNFTLPPTAAVPTDYLINPGDEFLVNTTGSLEANLDVSVDSNGRIFIPRVGAVRIAGVRYGDLPAFLTAQVAKQYRDFKLSVSVAQLHGIRVYVTGFANHPGAYTVSGLSTLFDVVLASGGPAAGGSYRQIELRRGGHLISSFDLYDLLLHGDRSKDALVQNEDVIFIAPVGPQVAITGSVNSEGIYEAAPGEKLGALLQDAGGSATLADNSRVVVSRLSDLDKLVWVQLDLSQAKQGAVAGGDIFRVLSVADYARPTERQGVLVKIEGEVDRPGNYYLPPNSTVGDLLVQAGQPTAGAYIYGTELDRASVQRQQEQGFERAISQLQLNIAAAPLTYRNVNPGDVTAARAVVDELRAVKPNGRVVLNLRPGATSLSPDMPLENNDRIYVPPRPTTVGVFGAVFRAGSFEIRKGYDISDYLKLAGGPEEIADQSEIFVVHANGEVQPKDDGALDADAQPGDVVFVPTRSHPNTLIDDIKDITSILFNAGLAAATVVAVTK